MTELGTVYRVEPGAIFKEGDGRLSRWLAEHLDLVGTALGMDLEPLDAAGGHGGDVVAREVGRHSVVLISDQISPSDDSQIGRLITRAGDKSARAVVWVGPELRRSHRQALQWFNRHAALDGIKFYALGVEFFRIDDSQPGVVLRLLEAPDDRPETGAVLNGLNGRGVAAAAPVIDAPQSRNDEAGEAQAEAELPDDHAQAAPSIAAAPAPQSGESGDREESAAPGFDSPHNADHGGGERQAADGGGEEQESYRVFFQRMVDELREKYRLAEARPAQAQNWYSLPSGIGGIIFSIWFASGGRVRAEVYIDTGDRAVNQEIFARLHSHASEIEKECSSKLAWDAIQGGRAYSVSVTTEGSINGPPETLDRTLNWAANRLACFKDVFGRRLPAMLRTLPPKAPAPRPLAPPSGRLETARRRAL